MVSTDTKHLKLRGNVWWYQRRIPKELLEQFNGQITIAESLDTVSIREARAKRDILNGKLEERKFITPNISRHKFIDFVQEMSARKKEDPVYWNEPYDFDKAEADGNVELIHAYTTVNERKDQRYKYGIKLKEALASWSNQKRKPISADSIGKTRKSVDGFLKHLNFNDIQLQDISKKQVDSYIELLIVKYATSTARGYISRLRSIWNYCEQMSKVTTPCPFDNHSFAGGTETNKKQSFTHQEINLIKEQIADENPIKQLLVKLAAFTGCRISELCSLQVKHVISEGDIDAIYIEKGKTDSATRVVPLTGELGERLKTLAESKGDNDLLFGFNGKVISRWFSRLKTAHISTDTAKSLHSFRVMFSTAMQRAEVIELKAAAILGHSRGNTMTYGYYSDGYTLPQLKEAYDQCVEKIIW
jgi:integrase